MRRSTYLHQGNASKGFVSRSPFPKIHSLTVLKKMYTLKWVQYYIYTCLWPHIKNQTIKNSWWNKKTRVQKIAPLYSLEPSLKIDTRETGTASRPNLGPKVRVVPLCHCLCRTKSFFFYFWSIFLNFENISRFRNLGTYFIVTFFLNCLILN